MVKTNVKSLSSHTSTNAHPHPISSEREAVVGVPVLKNRSLSFSGKAKAVARRRKKVQVIIPNNSIGGGETTAGKTMTSLSSSSWSASTNSNAGSYESYGSSRSSKGSSTSISRSGNESSRQRRKRIVTMGSSIKHSLRFKDNSDDMDLDDEEGSAALLAAEIEIEEVKVKRVPSRGTRRATLPEDFAPSGQSRSLDDNMLAHGLDSSSVFDLRDRASFANLRHSDSSLCTMALDDGDGSRASGRSSGSSHSGVISIKNLRASTQSQMSAIDSVDMSSRSADANTKRNNNSKRMQLPEHWVKSPDEICGSLKNAAIIVCCKKNKDNAKNGDGEIDSSKSASPNTPRWGWGRRISLLLLSCLLLFAIFVLVCATTDEGTVEELFPGNSKAKLALMRFRRYIMEEGDAQDPQEGGGEVEAFVLDQGNADVLGRPRRPEAATTPNVMVLVEERQKKTAAVDAGESPVPSPEVS